MTTLKLGDSGPEVWKLQEKLCNKGAMCAQDGRFGPGTEAAVRLFQGSQKLVPDGVVGAKTWAALLGAAAMTPVGFNPAGKAFMQRVDAFIGDAEKRHGVRIAKKAETRTASDAHRWHVAHMIFYNSFANQRPAHSTNWSGRHVIAWEHLKSPTLQWSYGLRPEDFLRTAAGVPVQKGASGKWVAEPDETLSRTRAYQILASANIAAVAHRPHGAMVACGYEGCGEPCKCGGHRSKHIAGMAVDLDRAALNSLENKLKRDLEPPLDEYFKQFGLHRPMMNRGPTWDEPWHVEGMTSI